jgi:glycosyltransferase involved in cell wall biosynthesis
MKKMSVLCVDGLTHFIQPILNTDVETRLFTVTSEKEIRASLAYADTLFIEWANELAIIVSNMNIPHKRILRLHSYEIFSDYFISHINWENIDTVIFVSPYVKNLFNMWYPDIKVKQRVIRNGVDLEKIKFKTHKPTYPYKIMVVASVNGKKNLQLLPLLADKTMQIDIFGAIQEIRYAHFIDYYAKSLDLNINFMGYVTDLYNAYADYDFILSTSVFESFGYGIAEGMAAGLKPIILDFPGANLTFPDEYLFTNREEFMHLLESSYDSHKYRQYIKDNFSYKVQVENFNKLFKEI